MKTKLNITPRVSMAFEVGAILYDSWGYEQTNIDFYCIIGRKGDWLQLLPMKKHTSEEIGFMTNKVEPIEIDFSQKPVRRKIYRSREPQQLGKELGFSFRNYSGGGWVNLWKGESVTESHYA